MIRGTAIRELSRPDSAEFAWDPDAVCVLVGDDAALSHALGRRLTARGWRVSSFTHAAAGDEGLERIVARLGRIGAWISLAPRSNNTDAGSVGETLLGNVEEEAWLFSQFRLARLLSPHLNDPQAPRTWFVAVTRVDGKLGLAPAPTSSGVVAAGVYGLVKTLRLEWPTVFCRAIDLQPGMDAAFAAERILEELHDPDPSLGEVGHALDGRATIGVFEASDA